MRYFILPLILLTGCSSLPRQPYIEKSRLYNAPKDIVWEGVIDFFTENSIPIKTVEKDSGLIYAEQQFTKPMSVWAECGTRGMMPFLTPSQDSVSLNLFVRENAEGNQTTVDINTVFKRMYRNIGLAPCNSTGILEEIIFGHIGSYILIVTKN